MGKSREPQPPLKEGTVLAGTSYVIVRLLGRGGQGEVYLAQHGFTLKLAVVKLLHRTLRGDQAQKEFRLEAVRQASLRHENIASVFDGGITTEDPPRPFFAMEYTPGYTLQFLIDKLRKEDAQAYREAKAREADGETGTYVSHWIPIRTTFDVIQQVCKALAYAHDAGLIHRDLKPANIYVSRENTAVSKVKLLDFGIADYLDQLLKVRDGMFRGTFTHAAPEAYRGISLPQSDLYSLTVVLYEMLTQRAPFWDAETVEDLIAYHQFNTPDVPSRFVDGLSPRLVRFVMTNLSKDPQKRARSAVEYARELREIDADYAADEAGRVHNKYDTDRMSFEEILGAAVERDELSVARAAQASHWDTDTRGMVSVAVPSSSLEAPLPVVGPGVPTQPISADPVGPTAPAPEAEGPRIIRAKAVDAAASALIGAGGQPTHQLGPASQEAAAVPPPGGAVQIAYAATQQRPYSYEEARAAHQALNRQAVTKPMVGAPGRVQAATPTPTPVAASGASGAPTGAGVEVRPRATDSRPALVRVAKAKVDRRVALGVVLFSTAALCAFIWLLTSFRNSAKKASASTTEVASAHASVVPSATVSSASTSAATGAPQLAVMPEDASPSTATTTSSATPLSRTPSSKSTATMPSSNPSPKTAPSAAVKHGVVPSPSGKGPGKLPLKGESPNVGF